ncbi:hypothetical protein BGZ70_002082 [Mortierella alpina]|uniref:Cytochrome P450 n=1 Tax=Mortierella alpina TaxID=64518 RepID=A0A9P6IXZ4_MORAP|nr:hypothetical protein BGZ70_002082 [Mortierella alpina]
MVSRDGSSVDKSIPTASLRPGETNHDAEYDEDADVFLARCEEQYGPVFNIYKFNRFYTVISDPLLREVFRSENLSFGDGLDDITGIHAFTASVTRAKRKFSDSAIHEMVRDMVTPNLALFTPTIVERMQTMVDREVGFSKDRKFVEDPLLFFQEMIASAMATVFMGHEIANDPQVLQTFIECTHDLARVTDPRTSDRRWRAFFNRAKYGLVNPLQKHIRVLVDAATPVVQERRRQEAEALEKGLAYNRPLDIMQGILDHFDQYGVVDLEDVCGHLLVMILVSVHTTSDSSTYLNYYLAAFPECIDVLYQEQLEVLDQICKEREEQRQSKLVSGEVSSVEDFAGTALDPRNDRDLSAPAVKRMVRVDSFVRECLRFRTTGAGLPHVAQEKVALSNGMTIHKGSRIIINLRSSHLNQDLQGEDAGQFRPWRFVGKSKAATKVASDFIPFGMGRHACPGRFLAVQKLKTVVAVMVSRYDKFEMQDPSKKMKALHARLGEQVPTGLYFTSR